MSKPYKIYMRIAGVEGHFSPEHFSPEAFFTGVSFEGAPYHLKLRIVSEDFASQPFKVKVR